MVLGMVSSGGVKVDLMGFTINLDTSKLDALCKRMKDLNDTQVSVGFFEGDNYGPENHNYPVALVAALKRYVVVRC